MSTAMPWERQDPLTQALYRVRMRGAFYSWTEAFGRGAVAMPQIADTLSFHMVARGCAFIEVDGEEAVRLDAGHLALVPRGIGHRVSTAPGARVVGRADELPQTMLGDSFSILHVGDPRGEELLAMLCGVVAFDAPPCRTSSPSFLRSCGWTRLGIPSWRRCWRCSQTSCATPGPVAMPWPPDSPTCS